MQFAAIHTNTKLLLPVSQGDEQAFTELFQEWQPFLATHIFRITRSRELTEEIVQDVFLKIWQNREVLPEIQSFKAYLLVVSKNHALKAKLKGANKTTLLDQPHHVAAITAMNERMKEIRRE